MSKLKSLIELKPGESGRILIIRGGVGLIKHLESMGVREGELVTKISGQILGGPQIVKVSNSQIAIGLGMARRILVSVEE